MSRRDAAGAFDALVQAVIDFGPGATGPGMPAPPRQETDRSLKGTATSKQRQGSEPRGDTFEPIVRLSNEAMLDDARWPETSALIDEALGAKRPSLSAPTGET